MSKKQVIVPLRGRYRKLLNDIGKTIEHAKNNAIVSVNHELVKANWEVGKHIVEFEQLGKEKAEYGSALLNKLSRDLKIKFGSGFSRRNVLDMRRFYLGFPIWQTVSAKLSWSHFITLLSISDESARRFYEEKVVTENWSVRILQQQVNSSLYERYTIQQNKKGAIRRERKVKVTKQPHEVVKDPYVLDFLGVKKDKRVSEKMLEQLIIDNLQKFILELGKGFAFVARQFKISIRNKHFYVDLVFYHRILKCFVLFDLKTRQAKHSDIGQMNLYLNYFKAEENVANDNDPIGIILSTDKDEILVEFAMGGLSNKIFVSKYQLYLPEKKELRKQVVTIMEDKKTPPMKLLNTGEKNSK
jgi:predicted nuclease of restriction endonuclease-like (RecB) superfamily